MSRAIHFVFVALIICFATLCGQAAPFVVQGEQLQPKQPQLAVGPQKAIHLVFGSDGHAYHCVSEDVGATFSKPQRVGEINLVAVGMRRGPRVATTKDAVVVTAIGSELVGGRQGNLFAWRSIDDGMTWQRPARVNDVDASAREGLHAMAAGPKGELYCVWLDLRNKGTEIVGSGSDDGGKTWSKNAIVYRSPDGSVCECCHPSVTISASGKLLVMWRNSLDGNRDMYLAESEDRGKTFGSAQRLGEGHWKLDECPMDGGAIAVDNTGNIHATWRRNRAVYLTQTTPKSEVHLGYGVQPWIALGSGGVITTWITRRPGDLMLMLPGDREPRRIATNARDPVVVGVGNTAIVAWESDEGARAIINVDRHDVRPGQ